MLIIGHLINATRAAGKNPPKKCPLQGNIWFWFQVYVILFIRARLSTLSVCLCLRNAALLLLLEKSKRTRRLDGEIGKVGLWLEGNLSLCSKFGMANLRCTAQTKIPRQTIHMLFYNSNCVTFKVNKGDIGLQYLYIVPGKIPITH